MVKALKPYCADLHNGLQNLQQQQQQQQQQQHLQHPQQQPQQYPQQQQQLLGQEVESGHGQAMAMAPLVMQCDQPTNSTTQPNSASVHHAEPLPSLPLPSLPMPLIPPPHDAPLQKAVHPAAKQPDGPAPPKPAAQLLNPGHPGHFLPQPQPMGHWPPPGPCPPGGMARPGGSMALYTPSVGRPGLFSNYPTAGSSGCRGEPFGPGTAPGPGEWAKGTEETPAQPCSSDYDDLLQGLGGEEAQCRDPPVSPYPQRAPLAGQYRLQVDFPGQSPKLVVWRDAKGVRRVNTEMGHTLAVLVSHTAAFSASVRLLLVYSKDSETTQPVHPCKIHQDPDHPMHMLMVESGAAPPAWEDWPHPSVAVAPAPSGEGKYSVNLRFLCRNSCNKRKALTLVCQLELQGEVLGRECFRVKISACPKRDANMQHRKRQEGAQGPQETTDRKRQKAATETTIAEAHGNYSSLSTLDLDAVDDQRADEDSRVDRMDAVDGGDEDEGDFRHNRQAVGVSRTGVVGVRGEALDAAGRYAHLVAMNSRFRSLHPYEHEAASRDFWLWWHKQGLR